MGVDEKVAKQNNAAEEENNQGALEKDLQWSKG